MQEDTPKVNAFFKALADQLPQDAMKRIATALGLQGDGPVQFRVGLFDE